MMDSECKLLHEVILKIALEAVCQAKAKFLFLWIKMGLNKEGFFSALKFWGRSMWLEKIQICRYSLGSWLLESWKAVLFLRLCLW